MSERERIVDAEIAAYKRGLADERACLLQRVERLRAEEEGKRPTSCTTGYLRALSDVASLLAVGEADGGEISDEDRKRWAREARDDRLGSEVDGDR